MSAGYSANPAAGQRSPDHSSPMNNENLPYRTGAPARKRVPVPGSAMQNGMNTGMLAHGLPTPIPESAMSAWQPQVDFNPPATTDPILQSQTEQRSTGDRSPYLTPSRGEQYDRPSISPSRSPNLHHRTPSQLDTLLRQNAELRQELENLQVERDQTQSACDAMLTELMTTQETLQERESELQSLREQLTHHQQQQHNPVHGGSPLSRKDEQELRDLRLRCNRLQGECRRKDEQLQQAQTQSIMHQNMYGKPASPAQHSRELSEAQQRAMDAESRANHAAHLHQTAQSQADAYAQQMREWSVAYDGLKASFNDLQRSHTQLVQKSAMELTQSKEDDEVKAALDDVKKMRDFFQENSKTVAKKNIEVTEQLRNVQDALHAKTREFEQQRGMLEALQIQVQ